MWVNLAKVLLIISTDSKAVFIYAGLDTHPARMDTHVYTIYGDTGQDCGRYVYVIDEHKEIEHDWLMIISRMNQIDDDESHVMTITDLIDWKDLR